MITDPFIFPIRLLQQAADLVHPADELLPAKFDADEHVLDVDGVALAAEVLEICSGVVDALGQLVVAFDVLFKLLRQR